MYRDNSLIPSEAIRLLALGILAGGDKSYAELAGEVRHFVSHITGQLGVAPLAVGKDAKRQQADRFAGDQAVVAVHDVSDPRVLPLR